MSEIRLENKLHSKSYVIALLVRSAPSRGLISIFKRRPETAGLLLLALAVLFNVILLFPEARIERVPVNDLAFHVQASQRLGESIARGEPFMDPWVSQWSLGYPLWRVYQPLPHLLGAAVIAIARPIASPAESFAAFYYVLLLLLPVSVYVGARLMGFNPLAAGIASVLILAPSEAGDFSRYGLGYGAYVWRGSGLYSELVALEVLLPTLGLVSRALEGEVGESLAAVALALTLLSHLFFGYIAFVSMALWALARPGPQRAQQVARAASITIRAMLLVAWFVVPMLLAGAEVNRSRWDPAYKFDSYGAGIILRELLSGRLLDFGRAPILSLITAAGALVAIFNINNLLARRLLVLTGVWLLLYFGRATWGYLIVLAGIPSQFHLHRLEAAFELFGVLLAAWGTERILAAALRAPRPALIAVAAVLCTALVLIGRERIAYLRLNTQWGKSNLAEFERAQGDVKLALAEVRAILAQRPGRVSAGKAADWGGSFKIGSSHVYSFLTREGFDQASFLYHTISHTSDFMVLRDENDPAHENLFGIRAVIAPATLKLPSYFQKRSQRGQFAVYEASPEGYFSLVDIGARYEGGADTWYAPVLTWLRSPTLRAGEVVALDSRAVGTPAMGRWDQVPAPNAKFKTARGKIIVESKAGEDYRATVDAQRQCYALIKITYHRALVAWVDGEHAPILRVSPDFGAIPLLPGHHEIEVRYQPGPLKPLLFVIGLALFVLATRRPLSTVGERVEAHVRQKMEVFGGWLATDRVRTAAALAVLVLLFTRGLLKGQLIDGHNAAEFLPRLAEFSKAVQDHHLIPIWAPDLSNGHGQPLFEFAPPLVYFAALPFLRCGMGLAGALQLGLTLLFVIGAFAIYLVARKMSFSRIVSVSGTAIWLFVPYQASTLYSSGRFDESAALAIAPLALLGLAQALETGTMIGVAIGAATLALVPIASTGVALVMLPAFAAIVIVRSALSSRPLRAAAAGFGAIAGGLGLSAYFWLPALAEMNLVKAGGLHAGHTIRPANLISPLQLIWGGWMSGNSIAASGGASPYLGPIHIVLAAAGVIVAVRGSDRVRRCDALTFAGVSIVAALLATSFCAFLWHRFGALHYLEQGPITLSVYALFMPLLALYALDRIKPHAVGVLIALIVLMNLVHAQPRGYLSYDEEFYSATSIAQRGINASAHEEYEPRWVQTRLRYTGDGILTPTPLTAVHALSWTSTRHEYSVKSPGPVQVMESTNYYPGWTALIDGRETNASPAPVFGAISFPVPPGTHNITIELRPTLVRRFSTLLSIFTIAIIIIGAAAAPLRASQTKPANPAYGATTRLSEILAVAFGMTLLLIVIENLFAWPSTGYTNGRLPGVFSGVVMTAIVGCAFAGSLRPLMTAADSSFRSIWIGLATIAAASALLVLHFPGYRVDIRCYESWTQRIATVGPARVYEPGYFLDYPPAYLYALWIAGIVAKAIGASGKLLRLIIETPALLANFALPTLLFAMVRRHKSARMATAATLMVALNPALLYDSVVWGQCDCVLSFTILLGIAALLDDQYELCFAISAVSVLLKPQGLILVPVLALWTLRRSGYRVWIRSAIAFAMAALIVLAPFQIGHPWNWIFDLYASTAAYYHETSVNAFNLPALLGGLRTPDSARIGPLSYYRLGMTLLVPLYAFVGWILWKERSPSRLLLACFITIFGFFMVAPRMHERYIYTAIVLAAPLALETPVMAACFAVLTSTGLFNIAYVLRTLQTPAPPGMTAALRSHDSLAMATSALNLAVLIVTLYYAADTTIAGSSYDRSTPERKMPFPDLRRVNEG